MNTTTRADAHPDSLISRFEATFGAAPDGVWAAPGRVNLIGEHTDYNEGFVLPFAINKRAATAVRLRDDSTVRLLSTSGDDGILEANAAALAPGSAPGWAKYPLGVVLALQQRASRSPASICCSTPTSRWARGCPPRMRLNAPSSRP
ncbi:galactokinase family protein [Burkholderia sp. RS01]|uniref:galactokinase family protein n=1 Tax=unclassified Burkholderia TaxID=2613784 RepID=UPI0032189C22